MDKNLTRFSSKPLYLLGGKSVRHLIYISAIALIITIAFFSKSVKAADLSTVSVSTIQTQVYTGTALTPKPVVKLDKTVLQEGVDYTLSYENNTEIGIATVTISGNGDYSGTITKEFTIKPPAITILSTSARPNEIDVALNTVGGNIRYQVRITKSDGSYQYTTSDSNILTIKGLELETSYPLMARTIKAVGDTTFYGSYSEPITVSTTSAIDISDASIDTITPFTYIPEKEWKPVPAVTLNGVTLKRGTDYTFSYENNTDVGTATITANGQGIYTGSISSSFLITKRALSTCYIPDISAVPYTGSELTPDPGVRYGIWLENGTDYSISYKNNTEIGKATAVLSGEGNFAGTVTKTFTIKPPLANIRSIEPAENTAHIVLEEAGGGVKYVALFTDPDGNEIKSYSTTNEWTATKLSPNTTYTVQIRTYKYVNGSTICGDYTTPQTITTNNLIDLKDAKIADIIDYTYTPGKEWKPVPAVSLGDTTLKRGTDYTFSYSNNYAVGTATITAIGQGIYTGSISSTFEIVPRDISTCYIPDISAIEYTGSPITPNPGVRYGNWLTVGTDYDITYKDNIEIGNNTATAVITGNGYFTGSVTKTFTIRPPLVEIETLETGEQEITTVLTPDTCMDPDVKWQIGFHLEGSDENTYITSETNILKAKNLAANTTYCIKARTLKKFDDQTIVYGAWSQEQTFSVAEHFHDYVSAVKEPATCTEDGTRIFTCTKCGDTKTESIPATGHKLHHVEGVTPTCTTRGHSGCYTCMMCGMRFPDIAESIQITLQSILSPSYGHDFVETNRVLPTLKQVGTITYTCSRCGEIREETIPMLKPGNTAIISLTIEQKKITAELEPVEGVSYQFYVRRASEANGRSSYSDETTLYVDNLTSNLDYMVKARTYVEVNGQKIYGDWTDEIPVHTKEFLQKVNGKDATCQSEGNITYWLGKSTGTYYQDETEDIILNPEDVIIPKLDHDYEEQTDETGNTILVCKNCGEIAE